MRLITCQSLQKKLLTWFAISGAQQKYFNEADLRLIEIEAGVSHFPRQILLILTLSKKDIIILGSNVLYQNKTILNHVMSDIDINF